MPAWNDGDGGLRLIDCLGGAKTVFYGIATIIKLLDERKADKRAEAVRLVSNDNALFEQVLEQRRAKERNPDAQNNGRQVLLTF